MVSSPGPQPDVHRKRPSSPDGPVDKAGDVQPRATRMPDWRLSECGPQLDHLQSRLPPGRNDAPNMRGMRCSAIDCLRASVLLHCRGMAGRGGDASTSRPAADGSPRRSDMQSKASSGILEAVRETPDLTLVVMATQDSAGASPLRHRTHHSVLTCPDHRRAGRHCAQFRTATTPSPRERRSRTPGEVISNQHPDRAHSATPPTTHR